ncbi:MAG TPA: hypothetical protein VH253_20125 [Phycisphaerae bacterium]|nr:hypothetical protein [Phycisphaerae bacterium]
MTGAEASFPSLPAGHQRIGFWGMLLCVPEGWNLHAYRGDRQAGMLVFADMREPRLEVRWRRARRGDAAMGEELRPIPGRHGGMAAHAHDARRAYELHFPRHASDPLIMRRVVEEFRRAAAILDQRPVASRRPAPSAPWYWCVYGAEGWVDSHARLLRASLLPGATRLDFRLPGLRPRWARLGSFSRAEQLREDLSLKQFALSLMPELRTLTQQDWTDAGDQATLDARSWVWPVGRSHRLIFRHDRADNRIVYRHDYVLGQYNDIRSPGDAPGRSEPGDSHV